MQVQFLSSLLIIVCLVACIVPSNRNPTETPSGDEGVLIKDSDTKNGDTQEYTPTLAVEAVPDRLMFYGDDEAIAGLEPQIVTVINDTFSTILIIDINIIDDNNQGGAEYFNVEYPDLDTPLEKGDELEMIVSFILSSQQRSALLMIYTTHPAYNELSVELSGKYFLW